MTGMYKFLVLACVALLAVPVQASERTISVDGPGAVKATPDTTEINLAVIANEASASAAMKIVSDKAGAVIAALVSRGIAKKGIQTGSVSLNPVYARRQGNAPQEPKTISYRASIDNRVRVPKLDTLGPTLDALLKVGIDRLSGISFFVADTDALQAQARTKAVKDAMSKAKQLSDAAGVKLGDIISIRAGAVSSTGPGQRVMSLAAAESSMPVMPGEVNVTMRDDTVFLIK